MAPVRTWLQSGNFTPKYNGFFYTKNVEFRTSDESSRVKKFELIESNVGGKNYKCVLTLNYDNESMLTWINEAKAHVGTTAGFSKFGKATFSYVTKGQITIELDSAMKIPALLDNLNTSYDAQFSQPVLTKIQDYSGCHIKVAPPTYFEYVYKLNIPEVEACWRSYKNKTSEKDSNGQDALHIAYLKGSKKLAETALKWGANIDSKDNYGNTILKLAVSAGDYDWYKFASNNGGSKLIKDATFNNLLHTAVKSYKGLLEVNKKETGSDSLDYSGLKNKAADYKLIIKDLANKNHSLVKQPNASGDTPIKIAAEIRADKAIFDTLVREIKYDHDICDVLTKAVWDVGAAVDA